LITLPDAAIGKKSGLACKNDQTPALVPNNQNNNMPIAFTLFAESKAYPSVSSPLNFLFNFILLPITAIDNAKKTIDKRPIRKFIFI
jgi:hypothetical protein